MLALGRLSDFFKDKAVRYEEIFFYVVIVAILLARISLIGPGITFQVDEARYFWSLNAIKQLSGGDLGGAILSLNSTQGRPGDAVIRLLPAIVQAVLYKKFGINTNTPSSLVVAIWMNWLVLVANAFLFFKISSQILKKNLAIISVLIYVSMVNTNLYIRHILPYDMAICLFLMALLMTIKARRNGGLKKKKVFKIGLLSGIAFTVYPGYFFAPIILGILIIELPINRQNTLRLLVRGATFALGFAVVIIAFELIFRFFGGSYLKSGQTLSTTIIQGDYSDGFSFIVKYLFGVEGVLGCALLALFLFSVLVICIRKISPENKVMFEQHKMLAIALFASWFIYASMTFFGHKLVFYGRIIHLFIPLLILVCLIGIESKMNNIMVRYALGILAIVSFLVFFTEYSGVVYARDVVFEHGIYYPMKIASKRYSTACGSIDLSTVPFQSKYLSEAGKKPVNPDDSIVFVNFGCLYPVECYRDVHRSPHKELLLAQSRLTLEYLPYQFEGYNKKDREVLANNDFLFQMYYIQGQK